MTSLAIKPKDPEKTDFENPEWTEDMFANAIRLQGLPTSLQAKLSNPQKPSQNKPLPSTMTATSLTAFVPQAKAGKHA